MALKLNTDCMLDVCSYLSIKDHLSMSRSCRRLRNIVRKFYHNGVLETTIDFWQCYEEQHELFMKFLSTEVQHLQKLVLMPRRHNHIDLLASFQFSNLKHFKLSQATIKLMNLADKLSPFLQRHSTQLEKIELKYIFWSDFVLMSNLGFPRMTHLALHTRFTFDPTESFAAAAIQFPQLKTLILINTPTIQDVWEFKCLSVLVLHGLNLLPQQVQMLLQRMSPMLKELSIVAPLERHQDECENEEMIDCFRALRHCQSLEKLLVDYHYFYMFAEVLPELGQLKRVKVYSPAYSWCECKDQEIPKNCAKYFQENKESVMLLCGQPVGLRYTEENTVDWVPVYPPMVPSLE